MLAAGDGGRLGAHTELVPKPLVPLNGRSIVDYTLEALAAAGVSDLTVVVGYRAESVVAELARSAPPELRLDFVLNPDYRAGASLSLRAARKAAGDSPFLLVMSDHLLSAPLLRKLAAAAPRTGRASLVACDFSARDDDYTEEATKVAVGEDGFVTAIGKRVYPFVGLDTGAFLFAPAAWEAVDAAPRDCELSAIFSELACRRALRAVDVSGAFWYDVDTAADLEAAALLVGSIGATESRSNGVGSSRALAAHCDTPALQHSDTPGR